MDPEVPSPVWLCGSGRPRHPERQAGLPRRLSKNPQRNTATPRSRGGISEA